MVIKIVALVVLAFVSARLGKFCNKLTGMDITKWTDPSGFNFSAHGLECYRCRSSDEGCMWRKQNATDPKITCNKETKMCVKWTFKVGQWCEKSVRSISWVGKNEAICGVVTSSPSRNMAHWRVGFPPSCCRSALLRAHLKVQSLWTKILHTRA